VSTGPRPVWLEHGSVAAWAPKPNAAPRRNGSAPTTKRSSPDCSATSRRRSTATAPDEIDAYAVDETIHHYHRAAAALWKFCFARGGGTPAEFIAGLPGRMTAGAEPIDWWERATPRRHQ
jgi:hypothetical protein